MARGFQISFVFLQVFLLANAYVMPRDDSVKLPDAIYEFCGKDTSDCLGGYKNADSKCFDAKDCITIVGFEKVDGTYVFQTFTHVSENVSYVGVGLSSDNQMADDGVVECMLDNVGSSPVNVYLSRTVGKSDCVRLEDQKGVNPIIKKTEGEYLYCQFNLTDSLNFGTFSVSLKGDKEYYLMGVSGKAKKDEQDHIIGVGGHRQSKMLSDKTYFKGTDGGDGDGDGDDGGSGGGNSIAACFSLLSILLFLTKFC